MILKNAYKMEPPLSAKPLRRVLKRLGYDAIWVMNEASGLQIFDLSGNGNKGSLVADTHFVHGKFGHALNFDGTGDYVDCGDMGNAENHTFTFLCSVKTTEAGNDHWIVSEGNTGDDRPMAGLVNQDGVARLVVRNDANSEVVYVLGTKTINDGITHQIVATLDGPAGTGRIYVDGVADGSRAVQTPGTLTLNTTTIGALKRTILGQEITAVVDFVMIFERALTAEEIALLYRKPFCMFERRARFDLVGVSALSSSCVIHGWLEAA